MPKNVMKLLKPSPHRARNDFDLSHRHLFDANFGEILPSTCIETVPGDHIELAASDLIRNIPFVTSPFLRAKQHLDVWFVPYRDLWHNFDQFIAGKKEPVSSAWNGDAYLPWFNPNKFAYEVNNASSLSTDIIGRHVKERGLYLLELLGYGRQAGTRTASTNDPHCNPFRIAAYNYIWYNEYRQQYYDDGTRLLNSSSYPNAAYLFNFDDLDCSTEATAEVGPAASGETRSIAMLQMRYRTWKKDLFSGVLPSTQTGAVSLVNSVTDVRWRTSADLSSFSTSAVKSLYFGTDSSGYESLRDPNNSNNTVSGGNKFYSQRSNGLFDVLALRKAEAVQIWRENSLRAGNRVKDNFQAHYGVTSDFQDHRPTYLGSVSAPLNISDVMATAESGNVVNGNVGDIAGKGTSTLNEKVFKYDAKDFGVIMVMFSMLPEAEYDGNAFERTNQLLEREDFFVPEFENLGLEAVGLYNVAAADGVTTRNSIIGYAPRYYGYKTKLDRVFGSFVGSGVFRAWSSQRSDIAAYFANTSPTTIPLQLLYVNPAIYDPNFNVGVSVSPQFMVDLYFDVDAVRPMSVSGMPFS